MTLLRELIDIPERIHEGDFVLKLSEGVDRADQTLKSYVVTEQLQAAFDAALSLVKAAVTTNSSKGALLHGSFGSGKSHFMAVLHQLLKHDPAAWGIAELSQVLAKHDEWMKGRRFLLVPYHLIGAKSLESAVLGGYVRYVGKLHPESPVPVLFATDPLFENARRLRETLGDDGFFQKMNARMAATAGTGWGRLTSRWDAASYERASSAGADPADRERLLTDLVAAHYPAYSTMVTAISEGFVPIEDGLAAISRHAKGLGYDAIVLFLDELILWLASNIADLHFVETESAKLVKLVESGPTERPAPVVSFIARQRDLKDLVGEHVAGAQKLSFGDALRYMRDRFSEIKLEDTNLPEIVEKRLLKPKDAVAARRIDEEFARSANARQEVLRVLLGREGDTDAFRKLYPFSPALVQTLVALSSVLQRNRTALRLLQQLLVRQRDTLALGAVVPVGDLFDELEAGVEPFSYEMRTAYDTARKLHRERFRPILLTQHRLSEEALKALPWDDPKATAFRNDDRLLKTLLVAALVPEVEALKDMRASRLSALNHGTIRAPIPGQEVQLVVSRCRSWSAEEGSLRVGDEADATISLQIGNVDVEGILEKALGEDNEGNKRAKLREILFTELGISNESGRLWQEVLEVDFPWRGVKRTFVVEYQNVREMSDYALRADGAGWKVVFDFPFDQAPHRPQSDLHRIDAFIGQGVPSRTLCWLPSFLGGKALADLGRLVRVDHVLGGPRFLEYTRDLSEVDRGAAKVQLQNMQSSLRSRLKRDVELAYGLRTEVDTNRVPDPLDAADHIRALDPAFTPRMSPGATLKDSFQGLLTQALQYQFPAHPDFREEVRQATCTKVLEAMRRALEDPDGRLEVEPGPMRNTLRDVAQPLKLGEAFPSHFIAGPYWSEFFERFRPKEGSFTVGMLRAAMQQPPAMGLPSAAQDLVILFYAERSGKTIAFATGAAASPEIGKLTDDMVLKDQPLPGEGEWATARERAARIFGLDIPSRRSPTNVSSLVAQVRKATTDLAPATRDLPVELERVMKRFGIDEGTSDRLRVARAAAALLEALRGVDERGFVAAFAAADVPVTPEAMGASIKSAAETARRLKETHWDIFEGFDAFPDPLRAEGTEVMTRLATALSHTENALRLVPRLYELEAEAIRLKNRAVTPGPQPSPGPVPPSPGVVVVGSGQRSGLDAAGVRKVADEITKQLGRGHTASISWTIVKKG